MAVTDELKNIRGKGYGDKPDAKASKGMDSGEENSTSRIIKLSDEEQKAFAQAKPGEDLECVIHGTLEEDGHFHVMSVGPKDQMSQEEPDMASLVAQKVSPTTIPSPS
jgi:hypothetical protein